MSWLRLAITALGLAALIAIGVWLAMHNQVTDEAALRHEPVIVSPHPRLGPIVVRPPRPASAAAAKPTPRGRPNPLEEPLIRRRRIPVSITMYCLRGTTRTDHPVRAGIIAVDPTLIPLGTVVDLYIGFKYVGQYLADDTGRLIKGQKIDVWTPSCAEARTFGRRRGAVVMIRDRKGRPIGPMGPE